MKLKTLLLTLFLVFTSSIPNAQALTKQEIAKTSLDSTVVVVVTNKQGNALQFGSGFVIKGGMVVSNQHVISGGTGGYILANDEEYKILGVLASDEQNDLAILKISEHSIPQLSIHSGSNLKVGADVYVAGNPLGLSGTFSEGMLSSIRKVKGKQLYQITAPISQGSSGGPVLDKKAVVVGVITSYIEDGQNINFAVPSTYLNTLINNIGPLLPLSNIGSASTKTTSTEITKSEIFKRGPKTNKEGKLTDICCAFGVELGKKLNPELLDTEIVVNENLAAINKNKIPTYSELNASLFPEKYYYKKSATPSELTVINNPHKWYLSEPKPESENFLSYKFIPENPYKGFQLYKVYLIDKDSLVYKIEASGKYKNCLKEMSILVDIILNKYAVSEHDAAFARANPSLGLRANTNNNNKRTIGVSCVFGALTISYKDSELKSLKDKIYKKKLRSLRDSSGL